MFVNKVEFYTSDIGSDTLEKFEDREVIDVLEANYSDILVAYIPKKYEVAFLLKKQDTEDSFKDEWVIAFYKRVLKMPEMNGTITLDNLKDLQETGKVVEIYKELKGSFEDVIRVSCDLIAKHKSGYEKELQNVEE